MSQNKDDREWTFEETDCGWKMRAKYTADVSCPDAQKSQFSRRLTANPNPHSDYSYDAKHHHSQLKNLSSYTAPNAGHHNDYTITNNCRPHHLHAESNSRFGCKRKYKDMWYTGKEMPHTTYDAAQSPKNVTTNWIGDMCFFHYTQGQLAPNCIDTTKCVGHQMFHQKY